MKGGRRLSVYSDQEFRRGVTFVIIGLGWQSEMLNRILAQLAGLAQGLADEQMHTIAVQLTPNEMHVPRRVLRHRCCCPAKYLGDSRPSVQKD
jgi:hypothetical protein